MPAQDLFMFLGELMFYAYFYFKLYWVSVLYFLAFFFLLDYPQPSPTFISSSCVFFTEGHKWRILLLHCKQANLKHVSHSTLLENSIRHLPSVHLWTFCLLADYSSSLPSHFSLCTTSLPDCPWTVQLCVHPPVMQSSLALHILYSHTVPNSLFRQHANEVGPIFGRWFVYSCSTDALTPNSQSSSCSSSEKVRVVSTRAPKLLVNLSKLDTTRLHVSMKRSVDTHKHSILEMTSQSFSFFL